jgi:hypothetical protein
VAGVSKLFEYTTPATAGLAIARFVSARLNNRVADLEFSLIAVSSGQHAVPDVY